MIFVLITEDEATIQYITREYFPIKEIIYPLI